MRVISQDGNIDIPYENAIITCEECVIKAEVNGLRQFCMGVYSTQERAQAVMKGLWKKYEDYELYGGIYNYPKVFWFQPDGEVQP